MVSDFLLKEVLLRGAIQELFYQTSQSILPDREQDVLSCKVQLTSLIALVATSVLFGTARLINGSWLPYIVLTTVGSIAYGVLAEHHGFSSVDIARMAHNVIRNKSDEIPSS